MLFIRPYDVIGRLCYLFVLMMSLVHYVIYLSLLCHWYTMLFTCPCCVIGKLCYLLTIAVSLTDYVIYSSL